MSNVETVADGILNVLLNTETGEWRKRPGTVLTTLATAVFGYDVAVGDIEYHLTSRAVLMLEELDLIVVARLYARGKAKANVLAAIRLQEEPKEEA